jgi:hypothetical protein
MPEEEADLFEWLGGGTSPSETGGKKLPPPLKEPWNPTKYRDQTARWLAFGSGGLFAGLVIDLLFRDSTSDLESKVLPVLSGFVGLAFGYYFRTQPPKDSI